MPETLNTNRLSSIDFLRGLVIVIMAIDHTRDLLHTTSLTGEPLDLSATSPWLFITRWVTHLCAPVFVFLAGASAYLALKSKNDVAATSRFLRRRGLWLIFLEVTVIGFGIWMDVYFRTFLFQVIFVIGSGLFILSFLLKIPSRVIGFIGLGIIALHNLSPYLKPESSVFGFIWTLLFERGFFKLGAERALLVAYPVLPWLGILLLGFGFGEAFTLPDVIKRKVFLRAGCIGLVVFIILRSLNLYGDPSHWAARSTGLPTFFSFINLTKYPPSLLYTAITLSILFFGLFVSQGRNSFFMRIFVTYGRVPLFFYILHWYIIHISMVVMIRIQGVRWADMPFGTMQFGRPASGVGLELPFVYLYWLLLIICMYPLCFWYAKYKASHPEKWWLKYL